MYRDCSTSQDQVNVIENASESAFSETCETLNSLSPTRPSKPIGCDVPRRSIPAGSWIWLVKTVCVALGFAAAAAATAYLKIHYKTMPAVSPSHVKIKVKLKTAPAPESPGVVEMPSQQQEAVGIKIARAEPVAAFDTAAAPGRIAADQAHFAFITARAPGVVRSVAVNIGQEVRAGDVLATIESPQVGRARLELRTQLQLLEVARAQATWQAEVHTITRELIEGLRRGDEPDAIQERLKGRPVGAGRERLMTAYAQYRLASVTMERNKNLLASNLVPTSQFQQVRAAYEAAAGTYQALLDSTEYEARLADLRAQQAARQASTAVGVAQEQLKILGVGLDMPPLPAPDTRRGGGSGDIAKAPQAPLSTYALVAPFDGTVLDRDLIVPGVSVDLTARLFTIADLSTVWLEVSISEGDFKTLVRASDGEVRFESPAYPGRTFTGHVLYRGDLVDEASRSIKLLAVAQNPDRLLKPGMFVQARVRCPGARDATRIPDSALVAEDDSSFVFVRQAADRFERRTVVTGETSREGVDILRGLDPGEEVVIAGASKLGALTEASFEGGGE